MVMIVVTRLNTLPKLIFYELVSTLRGTSARQGNTSLDYNQMFYFPYYFKLSPQYSNVKLDKRIIVGPSEYAVPKET